MSVSDSYRVILESRGNKFCIYYENSTIYCETIDFDGRAKETILVDSVYEHFLYSKCLEDNIYLLCQGRNKNFLLFIFDGEGWHMEELYLKRDFGSIIPLGLFALTDGIHIIYAKKLSLEYYYDLFQLRRDRNGWEKIFICEVYSKAMESSIDVKMTGYDTLHMISTLYDGETSSLSYYCYNIKNNKWMNLPIVNLNHSNIYIKTLISENNMNLFCYSFDNDSLNLFYFTKFLIRDSSFSLIDIIKVNPISKDSDIVIDIYNDILKIGYIYKKYYIEKNYNISLKQWEGTNQIALDKLPDVYYTKIIYDSFDCNLEEKEVLCSISDKLEISQPFNESGIDNEDRTNDKNISSKANALIQEQIDLLFEEVDALNTKINQIEEKVFNKYTSPKVHSTAKESDFKKSNFKENFMKAKPTSLKLEGSTVLSGDIKSTGIVLPSFSGAIEEKQPVILDEEKNEEMSAVIEEKIEVFNTEYPNKPKGIIKTVSEWFK